MEIQCVTNLSAIYEICINHKRMGVAKKKKCGDVQENFFQKFRVYSENFST